MRRFFTAPEAVQGNSIIFDSELAHHMGKVLRLAPGEQVTVCTGDGMVYLAELEQFSKDSVTGRILEVLENQKETDVQIVLFAHVLDDGLVEFVSGDLFRTAGNDAA